jgi:hypothetical protein
VSRSRGIEVSSTGILLDHGRAIGDREHRFFVSLEITLPERRAPLRAVARPIWAFGTQQAFKFIRISDADRLTLAEHVDLMWRRGRLMN